MGDAVPVGGVRQRKQSILGGKHLHQEVVMGIKMEDKEQHGEQELGLVSVALMVMTIYNISHLRFVYVLVHMCAHVAMSADAHVCA